MLTQGITLDTGERTLPARVKLLRRNEKYSFLELTIVEGKNRQVRRMIEALGGRVLKLVRTKIGNLALGSLPIGKYRILNRPDLAGLYKTSPESKAVAAGCLTVLGEPVARRDSNLLVDFAGQTQATRLP
jgi:16S rRNA U516 pseudouridylate synthase RsuA-like enzyme